MNLPKYTVKLTPLERQWLLELMEEMSESDSSGWMDGRMSKSLVNTFDKAKLSKLH